jgi:aerobic carbon-monoxide dehydrogenase small subunit
MIRLDLTVNGELRTTEIDGHESLLHVLREQLGLAGTKNACEEGECGSCAVRLDGDVVNSCLVLAAQAEGRDVVTVEGQGHDGQLHPVQGALLDTGAVQCGFCTPGLVVAIADLLERDPTPSDAVIRETLAGHLCRCTGYQKIVDAVRLAADRQDAEVRR